jgi:choline dehydrogenase-like flavoprotein
LEVVVDKTLREVDVSIGGAIEGEMKYTLDAGVETGVRSPLAGQMPEGQRTCRLTVLQYTLNKDPNDGDLIGIGLLPTTNKKGYRTTAASAFLDKRVPSNLTVVSDTQIVKVLFDSDRAIGVQSASGQAVLANKEVVLTAGAIDTPKLLLLSGIGPRAHLESLGIQVKADLPGVGKNLVDHPCVPLTYHMGPGFSQRTQYSRDPAGLEVARRQLDESGSGPLTKHYSSNTLAFLKKDELYKSAEFAALSDESKKLLPLDTVPSFEFAIASFHLESNLICSSD